MGFVALLVLAAAPQMPETIPSSAAQIRCDAPGGHFRLIKLTGNNQNLSATVRVLGQEPGNKADGSWAPAAGLVFALAKKNAFAGIQVYVNPYDPERISIALRQPGLTGGTIPFASAPVGKTISISARLENGLLTTTAGGLRQTARVDDKTITAAVLMCSSGSFEFSLGEGLLAHAAGVQESFDPWPPERR